MSRKFKEAEAERALMQWARNIQKGYENLGAHSIDYSDFSAGRATVTDDYSPQEQRCLKEMNRLSEDEPTLHKVAMLEYVWQSLWFAECRDNGGWREDITHVFHEVVEPSRAEYMKYTKANHSVSKTQYYNRRKRLIYTIGENVV